MQIPDDFKYGGVIAEATLDIRHAFIRKVYAILTVQLLLTALVSSISFFSVGFKSWIQTNAWMMWVSLFGSIGFLVATFWKMRSYPMNLIFLTGFTAMEAYSVAVITSFYDTRIVLEAVLITGLLFVMLTLFACQTKYDVTGWQSALGGALWFLIVFGLVGLFFPGSWMELAYAGGAALLFSVYIVGSPYSIGWITLTLLRLSTLKLSSVKCTSRRRLEQPSRSTWTSLTSSLRSYPLSSSLQNTNIFTSILRILNSTSDN